MTSGSPPTTEIIHVKSQPPLDREAKRRLTVIRHVEEVTGNVAMTCRYYGISRQAYYIWYRRYLAEALRTPQAEDHDPGVNDHHRLHNKYRKI